MSPHERNNSFYYTVTIAKGPRSPVVYGTLKPLLLLPEVLVCVKTIL